MLAIAFDFPAGRYHATPWGRHVNEADVAWPPDPWRIARALVCTWHRKVAPEHVSRDVLSRVVAALASELPSYALPPAVHAHTRHYMPSREGKNETRTLVFDAFARFGSSARLVAVWGGLHLGGEEERALDTLLERMSYLGRAESWVEACRLSQWAGETNCRPSDQTIDTTTGEVFEIVPFFAPRSPADYAGVCEQAIAKACERGLSRKAMTQILATLPDDWLAGLEVESGDLRAAGWSSPPGARLVHYARPEAMLRGRALPPPRRRQPSQKPTVARYAVYGKPLCRIEDAVRFGERLRRAVMGRARRVLGEEHIPTVLSGHGTSDRSHMHAFFLPEPFDPSGARLSDRIHHALIYAPAGFDDGAVAVLDQLRRISGADGVDWQLVLEGMGSTSALRSPLLDVGSEWITVTPYLHPWHRKARFEVADQIRRECGERGLPPLESVEPIPEIGAGGRALRPIHFHRFRSKRGLLQPDRRGSFWRLRFTEPARGPIALGFACHFGLGLFAPSREHPAP